jgi:hypothetical protein
MTPWLIVGAAAGFLLGGWTGAAWGAVTAAAGVVWLMIILRCLFSGELHPLAGAAIAFLVVPLYVALFAWGIYWVIFGTAAARVVAGALICPLVYAISTATCG